MRLREWVRRGRITTPPRGRQLVLLVLLGLLGSYVAWAVFEALWAIAAVIEVLVTGPDEDVSIPAAAAAAAAALAILVAVIGSYALRRLGPPPAARPAARWTDERYECVGVGSAAARPARAQHRSSLARRRDSAHPGGDPGRLRAPRACSRSAPA
jgi:hypothetical protein